MRHSRVVVEQKSATQENNNHSSSDLFGVSSKSEISSDLLAEQIESEMLHESSFWPKEDCTLFLWKIEKPPSRRWESGKGQVQISKEPFAQGTSHKVYKGIITTSRGVIMCVLKSPIKNDALAQSSSLFMKVIVDCFAKWAASIFNSMFDSNLRKIRLSEPFVMQLNSSKHFYFVQHWLDDYEKKVADDSLTLLASAFSHFTYHYSGGNLLMTGRFVNDKIVDHILIHSRDKNLFSTHNKGMEGMMKIMESHVCSVICQELEMSLSSTRNRSSSSTKEEKTPHRLDQHTDLFSPISKEKPSSSSSSSFSNVPIDSKAQQTEQNRQAIVRKFRELCTSIQQTQPLLAGLKPLITPQTYVEQPVDLPPGIELVYVQGTGNWEFYNHYSKTSSSEDPRGGGATYPPKPITPSGLKTFFSKIISPIGQTISQNIQNVLPQSPNHTNNNNNNTPNNANNNSNPSSPTQNNSTLSKTVAQSTTPNSLTQNNNNNNNSSTTTNNNKTDEIRTSGDGFELPTYD